MNIEEALDVAADLETGVYCRPRDKGEQALILLAKEHKKLRESFLSYRKDIYTAATSWTPLREPTDQMTRAGCLVLEQVPSGQQMGRLAQDVWRAMWDAAQRSP
jgi:hypothetical protein